MELKEEKVGIGPITKFDTADYKVKIAAEVKGFVPKERMDVKSARRMETFFSVRDRCGNRSYGRRRP